MPGWPDISVAPGRAAALAASLAVLTILALLAPGARAQAPAISLTVAVAATASGTELRLGFPLLREGEDLDSWLRRQEGLPLPEGLTWTTLRRPGQPGLPVLAVLAGLPPAGEPRLAISGLRARPLSGRRRLDPVGRTVLGADGLHLVELPATPDVAVYGLADSFPPQPARLDEVAWLRDHRLARLLVFPFRWRPADGRLEQVEALTLRLDTDAAVAAAGASSAGPGPSSARDGAATATDPLAPLLRGRLVNAPAALAWRGRSETLRARQAPAAGPRWKLIVDQDGWYQLSGADLAAAGVSVTDLDPRRLRLTQGGQELALLLEGQDDGRLDPQDSLGFWGERRRGRPGMVELPGSGYRFPVVLGDARYGDDNAYVLSLGPQPGRRIQDRDARPADSSLPRRGSLPFVLRQEPSNVYWAWHFTNDDVWFWDEFALQDQDVSRAYTVAVPDPDPAGAPALLRAAVVGRMSQGASAPVRVRLSAGEPAVDLDDQSWQGIARRELSGRLPGPPPAGGELRVVLTLPLAGGSPGVRLHLDWIEVGYDRLLKAVGGALDLPAPERPARLVVDGLDDGPVLALDLTDPRVPVRLSGLVLGRGAAGRQAEFASAAGAGRYWLGGRAAFRRPKLVGALPPSDLWQPAEGAEHLIISPAAFREGAERLAAHRRARGLSSRVVDLQEVYDQFGDGLAQPEAIRAFLAQALAAWPAPTPRFVLLVGDGTWNLRGSTAFPTEAVFMPPNMVFADPYQGEVDSANQLAAVLGEDALPDLAIGRAPVASAQEMDAFVAKTIAYETAGQRPYQAQHAFIADCSPDAAGDFVGDTERFIRDQLPAGATARRLRANDFPGACPPNQAPEGAKAVTDAVVELFNREGGLFINYVGHGSANRWSRLPFMTPTEMPRLANGGRLPIVLSWTCLDGYWCYPGLPCLEEELLIGQDRGSVAGFSPTGLGLATGHDLLWRGFYRSIYQTGTRQLGPAAIDAKLALWATGTFPDLIATYTVFGDPALRLPLPDAPALTRTPTASPRPSATPAPTLATVRGRAFLPLLQRKP